MSSIDRAPASLAVGAFRLAGIVTSAAMLAACAQSSVVTDKSAFHVSSRSVSSDRAAPTRTAALTTTTERATTDTHNPSLGLASYYNEGTRTASGERFDAHELTAAHPTLPFGTRLRVTNVVTGKSVTVRVNDRGPFVRGRVVDVSYSAAESLGMVGRGVAKVKLDVVQ
jgi:rare lipoprotein A